MRGGITTMKQKAIVIMDIFLVPVCFLFLMSTCVKILSYTSFWTLVSNDQKLAIVALAFFSCLSLALTPLLHREIQVLRLPLGEWLRFHHLR